MARVIRERIGRFEGILQNSIPRHEAEDFKLHILGNFPIIKKSLTQIQKKFAKKKITAFHCYYDKKCIRAFCYMPCLWDKVWSSNSSDGNHIPSIHGICCIRTH